MTGAIIFVLLRSRCRFATLRAAIPDITDRMLCDRLQEFEQEGIVERTVIPETPVRVEYSLTRKGRELRRRWTPSPSGPRSGDTGAQGREEPARAAPPAPPPAESHSTCYGRCSPRNLRTLPCMMRSTSAAA